MTGVDVIITTVSFTTGVTVETAMVTLGMDVASTTVVFKEVVITSRFGVTVDGI